MAFAATHSKWFSSSMSALKTTLLLIALCCFGITPTTATPYRADNLFFTENFELGSNLEEQMTCISSGGTIAFKPFPTMCPGVTPSNISNKGLPTPFFNGCSYKYIWKQSTSESTYSGGAAWTTIVGATNSDYNPPALNTTTSYVRLAYNSCCATQKASNVIKIAIGGTGCTTTNPTPTPTCTGNTVLNSSFESGQTNWTNWGGSTIITDTYSGAKAMQVSGVAGGGGQDLPAIAGKTYTLVAYGKKTGTEWGGIGFKFLSATYAALGVEKSVSVTSSTYQPYTVSVVAPAGTAYVTIYYWKSAGNGALKVDDYCLTNTGSTTPPSTSPCQTAVTYCLKDVRNCSGTSNGFGPWYDILINGVSHPEYKVESGQWVQSTNGTVAITARLVNVFNPNVKWDLNGTFSGCVAGAPHFSNNGYECTNANNLPAPWYFYNTLSATMTGVAGSKVAGAKLNLNINGLPPAQVGLGATTYYRQSMGMSVWTKATVVTGANSCGVSIGNQGTDFYFELGPCTNNQPTCDNLTSGGTIGPDQTGCTPYTATTINSLTLPSGGDSNAAIEYVWLKTTVDPGTGTTNMPTCDANGVVNLKNWTMIAGATGISYTPTNVTQTTWYLRCARRAGCTCYYGESNVVKITIAPSVTVFVSGNLTICNGSTTTFTASGGGQYTWSNGQTTSSITVGTGTYSVTATNGTCSNSATITVTNAPNPSAPELLITQPTCSLSSGSITITNLVPGSNTSLDNGVISLNKATYTNISLGTHTIIVYNAQGCSTSKKFFINNAINCTAFLGNFVWKDVNADGFQNINEPGIPNVTVTLFNSSDVVIGTTKTDSNGYYSFINLTPGAYYVQFTAPVDYIFTLANQGTLGSNDSDADPVTGKTKLINLVAGENNVTIDAGMTTSCNNLTNAGTICCEQSDCGPYDPEPITNGTLPTGGGFADIYYVWLKTKDNPTGIVTWDMIPNSNDKTYDPAVVSQTTYFRRCAFREGCTGVVETPWIKIEVLSPENCSSGSLVQSTTNAKENTVSPQERVELLDKPTDSNEAVIFLYPNPTKDVFYVAFPKVLLQNVEATIFTQTGEVVKQETLLANQQYFGFDARNFMSGMYIMQLKSDNEAPIVKKLYVVKE